MKRPAFERTKERRMAEPRSDHSRAVDDCVFAVVGEHREDPDLLLLLGTDDRFYQLDLTDGHPTPVELADCWQLDLKRSGLSRPNARRRS
jgi:hypothetical protein